MAVRKHRQKEKRAAAERTVVETEAQKQSSCAIDPLIGFCHVPVIAAGPDGRITSWNAAAEALFGYRGVEAVGSPITKLIPHELRRKHREAFRRHVTSGGERFGRTFDTEGLRKDGTKVPVELSVSVGHLGGNMLFTAVVRDMTAHREMLERLNDALQQLQFHVERMPLAYIVWDAGFRVTEWNPAAERIFGYAKSEALGKHAYELIVPRDAVPSVNAVWSDLLRGDTSSHSMNANVRKDGSRLTCEWFNTPLHDAVGRIRGVASMAMDVSEREAVEGRMRDAQKLESLGLMAGGIAHDFNSSLMIILGNSALLRSTKGLPPRAIEHIELIEEAGSRADQLIKHLLAYARTGRHNPLPTDLNAVIREAVTFVHSSVGKHYELNLQPAERLPAIFADRSQVEQIILHLCLNAGQAMPGRGTIGIITRETNLTARDATSCVPNDARPGKYVEMTVTDTGCGMDEATMARVFDPFFTTKTHGHGLGLAAVLGILRQHLAFARIESRVGRGTKVHVLFPLHREQRNADEHEAAGDKAKPAASRRRDMRSRAV